MLPFREVGVFVPIFFRFSCRHGRHGPPRSKTHHCAFFVHTSNLRTECIVGQLNNTARCVADCDMCIYIYIDLSDEQRPSFLPGQGVQSPWRRCATYIHVALSLLESRRPCTERFNIVVTSRSGNHKERKYTGQPDRHRHTDTGP